MNFIVVGASAGLGRALADELASKGHNLLIVASRQADLDAQASDLQLRYSIKVQKAAMRIGCDEESVTAVMSAVAALGQIDGALFPIGYSRGDDDGTLLAGEIEQIMGSNLTGIMALSAAILAKLQERGEGVLVYFGSVAAERGRSSNIVYAAAKRGLQSFAESLRHRCGSTKILVQYYQLGYLNTAQTWGKKLPFPIAEPEQAARFVVSRLNNDFGQAYFPWFWCLICMALRFVPWFMFKKLKF